MTQHSLGMGRFALNSHPTGPLAGDNLSAYNATARIATANVDKQAGIGLHCGTHGKTFPCTVVLVKRKKLPNCWLAGLKNDADHPAKELFGPLAKPANHIQISRQPASKSRDDVPNRRRQPGKGSRGIPDLEPAILAAFPLRTYLYGVIVNQVATWTSVHGCEHDRQRHGTCIFSISH